MSQDLEVLKNLSRRWFEEVWNQQRQESIDELAAPDAIVHGIPAEPGVSGVAAFKAFHAALLRAFPDLTITVHDVIAEGTMAALRFEARGSHRGEHLGLAPTGRSVIF